MNALNCMGKKQDFLYSNPAEWKGNLSTDSRGLFIMSQQWQSRKIKNGNLKNRVTSTSILPKENDLPPFL